MSYYEKYLKYKTKYLDLKAQLGGNPEEACPVIHKEDKFCKELNPNLSKNFDYLSYAYACATKRDLVRVKSNQDKLVDELKSKLASKKRIGSEHDIYFEVLEAKYKESNDKIYGKLAIDLFDYIKKESNVRIDKNEINKVAPTLLKAFRGITQKQVGSNWYDK